MSARRRAKLWFDVERRYKTITSTGRELTPVLWFDVERRYKTIMEGWAMYDRR